MNYKREADKYRRRIEFEKAITDLVQKYLNKELKEAEKDGIRD